MTAAYVKIVMLEQADADAGQVLVELGVFLEPIAHDNDVKIRFAQKVGASGGSSNPAAISHQGHTRQLTDFVNAIKLGGKPLVDGKEGRRAVELIQAIYASNATGKVIHIK